MNELQHIPNIQDPEGGTLVQPEHFETPQGRYDNVINVINMFPLRIITLFILILAIVRYTAVMGDNDHVELTMWAVVAFPALAILAFQELIYGGIAKLIKGILIRLVMRVERNAEEL